jgi:putative DNA primase/helicase
VERALTDGAASAHDHYKCDEQGLAARFVAVFGGMARFSGDEGRWRGFDGIRWAEDTPSHHRSAKMMEAIVDLYVEDAAAAQDESVARAIRNFAKTYRTHGKVASALKTAERHLLVSSDEFDHAPTRLNVANGTLDLRTGALRPPSAADLITRLASVAYDPDATAPRFQAFLTQVLPDAGVREWLQRFIGYAVAGDPKEQCFCTLLGDGSNGKSTLIAALSHALGDYAMATQANTFTSSSRTTLPAQELARMGHATRLVFTSEPAPGAHLDESFIKQFTGGDTIVAKGIYAPPRSFRPQAVLVMAVNEPLELSTSNVAMSRRIKVVPFDVIIGDRQRERDLGERLRAEASGILNWVVAGYQAYLARGLAGEPVGMREAAEAYMRSSDTFADFFDECCELRPDARIQRTEMYTTYVRWCRARDVIPRSNTAVISSLRQGGLEERKSRGVWCWLGVRTTIDTLRSFQLLVENSEVA